MKIAAIVIGLSLACCGSAFAQATRPAASPPAPANKSSDINALEVRANEAFSSGQYALALPLLKKVEAAEKADSTQYGATAEQISVCQANLALSPSPMPAAGGGEVVPMSPETRKPHAAPKAGDVLEMSIKELGNFEYDQVNGGDIPTDVKRLSGSTIRLTGFMVPSDQAENITQFALVPSLFNCCFGQPPQIQHTVMVNCPAGKAVGFFQDPIVIEGKLTVEEKKDDGYIVSIFSVDVTSVKPAPK